MTAKKLFIILFLVLSYNFSSAQTSNTSFINYQSDEFTLDGGDKISLDDIYNKLKDDSYFEITIIGHTDKDGSDDYNLNLAQKRAQEVNNYLVNLGMASDQITIDWKGENQPVAEGQSSDAKGKNRRVEISYQGYNFNSVFDIIENTHEVEEQHYIVSVAEDLTLELDRGTQINVPAECFEYADGSGIPESEIEFHIKETFDYSDFISEGLFTHSKGEILETGGMLYVDATANGKPLVIREGKSIELVYPMQETKEGMELFYADPNSEDIDWEQANQNITVSQTMGLENDVEIDFSQFLNFEIPEKQRPSPEFAQFPRRPKMQDKPYPPSDQIYDDKKYDKLYNNYLINLDNYNIRKPIYEQEMVEWNLKVDTRISEVYGYKRAFREFHAYAKTRAAVNTLQSMIGKRSNLEIIEKFEEILSNPLDLTIDDQKIFNKAFGNQTRDILRERKIYPRVSDYRHIKNEIAHQLRAFARQVKNEKIKEAYNKTGRISKENFGSYIANINKMGWINCDRFIKTPEFLLASVSIPSEKGVRYYMIFKDIKSILSPRFNEDQNSYDFERVPRQKDVRIVGIKLVDDKPQLAVKEITIDKNNYVNMNFAPGTLSQIKNELSALDDYSGE